jgi:hypothetical protein
VMLDGAMRTVDRPGNGVETTTPRPPTQEEAVHVARR